jgi:putative transposase
MRPNKLNAAQVAAILLEREAGAQVAELCRIHGISVATFYKLRAKYGSLDSSGVERLRRLELENLALRKLLAITLVENVAYKEAGAGQPIS